MEVDGRVAIEGKPGNLKKGVSFPDRGGGCEGWATVRYVLYNPYTFQPKKPKGATWQISKKNFSP